MLDTWTPALLQASSDRGLVSTKGQFSGTSDSLVKLSRVSRGGGGGGDMMRDRGHRSGLTGGLSSSLMSEWKRFSELSAAAFALLLHTDREKPVIARFIWKEIKYGFVLICHLTGLLEPNQWQCLHLRPILWFISFIEWLSGATHHPLTSYILSWFCFNLETDKNHEIFQFELVNQISWWWAKLQ